MKSYSKSGQTGMRKPGSLPTPRGATASPSKGSDCALLARGEPLRNSKLGAPTSKYSGNYKKGGAVSVASPYEPFDLNGVPKL